MSTLDAFEVSTIFMSPIVVGPVTTGAGPCIRDSMYKRL